MDRVKRWTLIASVLGSSMAFIDGSVVNVALHAIESDLGGGLAAQQWIVDAYLLTLGSLILVGGWLISISSWRVIFLINVPIALATGMISTRLGRQRADLRKDVRVDLPGAFLCATGLGLLVAGFIEQPSLGWSNPLVPGAIAG